MLSKTYFQNKKKNAPKVKISLIKASFKSCLISPFPFKIKNNQKTNFLIDNEINLREILNNALKRTNNIYENFYYNQIDIKLDNEQNSKRSKIIKYIKDFIEVNINYNKTAIFCEIIFFFDLLIIQNKKNKNAISFEKLGLGALILVLKFHRLQKNVFIKKYKSIFNDKYMTLDEIKKIEVSSLKMINYDITQPHPIYYIDLLYNNIFSSSINSEANNNNYNYRQIISLIKYILTFSNNYIRFHPFYLATFIIKYCLEQNKTNEFRYKFILFFDINIRDFKSIYDEFLNIFKNQITIAKTLLKQKYEIKNKKLINKSLIYNKPSIVKIGYQNLASITLSNGFEVKREKKLNINNVENNNNIKNNCQTKLFMNSINNTCYKRFLDNYIEDNLNNINKENNSIIVNLNKSIKSKNKSLVEVNTYQKNINCSLESPKKCGISINYRLKKNLLNKNNNNDINNTKVYNIENENNKLKRSAIEYSLEKKNKTEHQKNNKEEENINNKKNKRLNSEVTHDKINHNYNYNCFNLRGDSIRKKYKSKNKEKNASMNLINENNENTEEINNKINNYKEKTEKIKVNTLNRINNYQNKFSDNKKETSKISYYYDIIKKNYNDDSYFRNRSTINQSETSLNKNINRENDITKGRKINIRNFYKIKNAILLKYKDFDKKDIFIS